MTGTTRAAPSLPPWWPQAVQDAAEDETAGWAIERAEERLAGGRGLSSATVSALTAAECRWYRQLRRMGGCQDEATTGRLVNRVTGHHLPAGCKVRWCAACHIGLLATWRGETIRRIHHIMEGRRAVVQGPLLLRLSFEQQGHEPTLAMDAALRCWARCWRKLKKRCVGLERCDYCQRPAPATRRRRCIDCRRAYHPRARPGEGRCETGHRWSYCPSAPGEWCRYVSVPWLVVVETHKSGWPHLHPVIFTAWMSEHGRGRASGHPLLDACWRESMEEGVAPGYVWIEEQEEKDLTRAIFYATKYTSKGSAMPAWAAEWCTKKRRRLRSRWQRRGYRWPEIHTVSAWTFDRAADVRAEDGWVEPVTTREIIGEAAHASAVTVRAWQATQ